MFCLQSENRQRCIYLSNMLANSKRNQHIQTTTMSQTSSFTYLHYSLKLQILSFASCSTNKQGRVRYWKSILALAKLFCLDRFVWKHRWLHWHSFASEVYYRFYSTFCIYWYVILERMELIAIAIYCISFYLRNLVEQAIHFVFIKIYIENKICCCCNHKIMKLPLTINLGLL